MNTAVALTPESQSGRKPSRFGLVIATFVAVCWVLCIATLALLTSNEVTLNRLQILESTWVVNGRVSGPNKLAKTEIGDWPFKDQNEITVANLPQTGAIAGRTYLVPLIPLFRSGSPVEGLYVVTPTHLPNALPLIYPSGKDADQQLQEITAHE